MHFHPCMAETKKWRRDDLKPNSKNILDWKHKSFIWGGASGGAVLMSGQLLFRAKSHCGTYRPDNICAIYALCAFFSASRPVRVNIVRTSCPSRPFFLTCFGHIWMEMYPLLLLLNAPPKRQKTSMPRTTLMSEYNFKIFYKIFAKMTGVLILRLRAH